MQQQSQLSKNQKVSQNLTYLQKQKQLQQQKLADYNARQEQYIMNKFCETYKIYRSPDQMKSIISQLNPDEDTLKDLQLNFNKQQKNLEEIQKQNHQKKISHKPNYSLSQQFTESVHMSNESDQIKSTSILPIQLRITMKQNVSCDQLVKRNNSFNISTDQFMKLGTSSFDIESNVENKKFRSIRPKFNAVPTSTLVNCSNDDDISLVVVGQNKQFLNFMEDKICNTKVQQKYIKK